MNKKRVDILYDEYEDPYLLILDREEYYWNGHFDIPVDKVKTLTLEEFPLDIQIKPYLKEKDGCIYPLQGNFSLLKTEEGLFAIVEGHEYTKYWDHPIISLACYMECLKAELESGDEFELLDFNSDEDIHYDYLYETKLVGVESIAEAIKVAQDSLKALEKRVRYRVADKVKEWAESL
jgi:hypothetical protein